MNSPTYTEAMVAPIRRRIPIGCQGTSCHQAREKCKSPLRCSGAEKEADAAIASFGTRRVEMPITFEGDEPINR